MTIKSDATTIKLCSPASVWKSHRPNSFKKAIERIDGLLDSLDENVALKAAVYTIDQHQGKAQIKIDHTTDGEKINNTVINVLTAEEKVKMVDFNSKIDAI